MARVIAPTLQQMRLFEAVARHGSITRAAEEVNLTQPSVSMQVRSLEDKLGVTLTEQIGKRLHLTAAGELTAAASRDILARLGEMESALEDLSGEVAGPLNVAVVTTAKYFLPKLLGDFKGRFPRVQPRLTIANRETMLARIDDSADDLFIMGRPPERHAVDAEPFLENVIVFVAPPGHRLVGRRHIPLGRIAEEDVLRREEGSGTRLAVDGLCRAAGVELVTHMEFDDLEAIKQGVISGLGLAYLPLHAVRLEIAAGELAVLDVEGFPLRRRWYALHRRGRRLSNAAQSFLDFLKTESQAALGEPGAATGR